MLILERHEGESLVIIHEGKRMVIHWFNKNRIGLEGDKGWTWLRGEIEERAQIPTT
jgi:sRNA-binding carbon storage regulator CsrA